MNEMSLAMDLLVLGTSGCAVLYCGQLARRLGRLRDAEAATPKALAALAASIEESRQSSAAIAQAADRATAEMRAALTELSERRVEAEDLAGILDGQAASAERRLREAQEAAEVALTRVTRRAGIELEALSRAVDIAAKASEASGATRPAKKSGQAARRPEPLVLRDEPVVRQRAAAPANPFLRAVG